MFICKNAHNRWVHANCLNLKPMVSLCLKCEQEIESGCTVIEGETGGKIGYFLEDFYSFRIDESQSHDFCFILLFFLFFQQQNSYFGTRGTKCRFFLLFLLAQGSFF